MKIKENLSQANFIVIVGLVLSVFIIFIALDIMKFPFSTYDRISYYLCLGNTRHTVGVIGTLIIIPLCTKKIIWGFVLALILSTVIFILCFSHVIHMLINNPPNFTSQIHGPIIWSVVQLPVIIFSYISIKENKQI